MVDLQLANNKLQKLQLMMLHAVAVAKIDFQLSPTSAKNNPVVSRRSQLQTSCQRGFICVKVVWRQRETKMIKVGSSWWRVKLSVAEVKQMIVGSNNVLH